MERKDAVNEYVCPQQHRTVTKNMDEGVTPFLIGCPTCKAAGTPPDREPFRYPMAESSFYRVPQNLDHSHEWYRPHDMADLDTDTADHVRNGGLLLRERSTV